MRITDGVIYLSQPIGGCWTLEGPAVIGTTWLDYTMPEADDRSISNLAQVTSMSGATQDGPTAGTLQDGLMSGATQEASMSGATRDGASLHGRRLLIPITNVIAVVVPDEAEAAYRAPLP